MPGDEQIMTVPGLRDLASQYQRQAGFCDEISAYLNRQAQSLFWQSEAATGFKEQSAKFVTTLRRFQNDFNTLNKDLSNRADDLERSRNV
ncbi:MAG: hypothetical protein EPO26_11585 [Chloroflexota bacterium]|nr:MAG: hypothetical protein EPO26_11585 [Chloroflexota bacterium]